MKRPKLLLVGYGRLGKPLAAVLKRRFEVHALDVRRRNPPARGIRRAGIADLPAFELVILAIPVSRLEAFLRRNGHRFAPGSTVIDLSAVKVEPQRWLNRHLPKNVTFVGLHPLFGPDTLEGGFAGHTVVACGGRSTAACHRRMLRHLRGFGLTIVETNPRTHDRTMASTLFLTHLVGRLAFACEPPRRFPFEPPSYAFLRGIMRRASNESTDFVPDLLRYNPYARSILNKLRSRLLSRSGG